VEDPADPQSEVVAALSAGGAWDAVLYDLLPEDVEGIYAILSNTCNQNFTFEMVGRRTIYMGIGDLHDTSYDSYEVVADMAINDHADFASTTGSCKYSMRIYPSAKFENQFKSSINRIVAIVISVTFAVILMVFVGFETLMQTKRQARERTKVFLASNVSVSEK